MKSVGNDNVNKLIFGYLNINSIRNNFELLKVQIKGNLDMLLISETKIDDTFSYSPFLIEGFSTPHMLGRDSNDGGILLYVCKSIPFT